MSFRRKGSPYYWISYYDPTGRRIRESTKFERKAQADILERSKRNAIAFARGGLADPDAGMRTTFAELVDWPTLKRTPLFPVLCVNIRELPFTPEFFRGSAYLALFTVPDEYEHSAEDRSLVVRRYPRIDALTPLPSPPEMAPERLALQFREVEDLPMPEVIARVLGRSDLDRTELARIGECHAGIKLGGYPHFTNTAFLREAEPDYQVQLDGTELYDYADTGIGFVYDDLKGAFWESM